MKSYELKPLSEEEKNPYDENINNFIKNNNVKDFLFIFTTKKTEINDNEKLFVDFASSPQGFKFISEALTKILTGRNEDGVFLWEIFLDILSKTLLEIISDDYNKNFSKGEESYVKLNKLADSLYHDVIKTVKF